MCIGRGLSHRYLKGTLFRRPSLQSCICVIRVLHPDEWVYRKHLTNRGQLRMQNVCK